IASSGTLWAFALSNARWQRPLRWTTYIIPSCWVTCSRAVGGSPGLIRHKDIAAATGVSVFTVGMILSGQGANYNATTRKHVLETAERLGYQPSVNARALMLQRSLLIGVLLNEVNTHMSGPFQLGIQKAISGTDYSPVVFFSKDESGQKQCLRNCLNRQVDALLVNCLVDPGNDGPISLSTDLKNLRIPLMETFGCFLDGIPNANINNREAGRLCSEHLLALGHRRIVLVTHGRYEHRTLHADAWEQFLGYRDALASAGLEPIVITPQIDFENVTIDNFVSAGHDAINLMPDPMPTAAVCYADVMAYGLNRACRERGIRVPADFSISGNLDMLLSASVNPPLTTTRANYFEVGYPHAERADTCGQQLGGHQPQADAGTEGEAGDVEQQAGEDEPARGFGWGRAELRTEDPDVAVVVVLEVQHGIRGAAADQQRCLFLAVDGVLHGNLDDGGGGRGDVLHRNRKPGVADRGGEPGGHIGAAGLHVPERADARGQRGDEDEQGGVAFCGHADACLVSAGDCRRVRSGRQAGLPI
ncbi:MAG: LacI family DNA-binding transcriptional regulator, partial [Verrucomicrobia bacterium]|nr:LacI family DNA-binding transcriptional regulator [Verrucomicrobiota bacterium]